jgi:hypothetical protein
MKTLAVVLLAVMLSCGTGTGWTRPSDVEPMPGVTVERVIDRRSYLDVETVPSVFRRPEDPMMGRMNLLFSDQGNACVVNDQDFVMAADGDTWPCVWRRPRGF